MLLSSRSALRPPPLGALCVCALAPPPCFCACAAALPRCSGSRAFGWWPFARWVAVAGSAAAALSAVASLGRRVTALSLAALARARDRADPRSLRPAPRRRRPWRLCRSQVKGVFRLCGGVRYPRGAPARRAASEVLRTLRGERLLVAVSSGFDFRAQTERKRKSTQTCSDLSALRLCTW